MNNKTPLSVGFDLDGVLLYNPARIFRPITNLIKRCLPKGKTSNKLSDINFYYPSSGFEKIIWRIVHWSSLFVADSFSEIEVMSKKGLIKPYIITSRYDCLKDDFEGWLSKINAHLIFTGTFHNKDNIQPHLFKEKKIKELKLDYFVEDNWDIVRHLTNTTNTKILWISNVLDKRISYKHKFLSLKDAISYLKQVSLK